MLSDNTNIAVDTNVHGKDTKKNMVADKGRNLKEKISEKLNEHKTNKEVAVGIMSSCWNSSPKCKFNMMVFLKRAKSYAHLLKDGLLANPFELKKIDKCIVPLWCTSVRAKFDASQKTPFSNR